MIFTKGSFLVFSNIICYSILTQLLDRLKKSIEI